MARKLPWAAGANTNRQSTTKSSSTISRPTKRVKKEIDVSRKREQVSPSVKSDPAQRSSSTPPINDSRSRIRDGRSASTSPPPAPPPIELMRSGLDEDDIYMLVEDEFQAIAQSYTAHLHHAEYKRLTKIAQERKAEQQRMGADFLDGEGIPANVSGLTRQHLKRKLLSERQSSGVKSMLGTTLMNGTDDEDEDEAREAILAREEKKVGDMWAGTALGGLMSWNHSQERPSLKGLEKLGGETRASKGFGPSRRQMSEENSNVIHIDNAAQKLKRSEIPESSTSKSIESSTQLDPRPAKAILRREPIVKRSTSTRKQDPPPTEIEKVKLQKPLNKPLGGQIRSFIDSLDDFDDAAFDATQAARHNESPEKSRPRSGVHQIKKEKKDRKDRLDEVPVFLI